MPAPSSPNLDENTIDDILYLARANESDELFQILEAAAQNTGSSAADVLDAAVDKESGCSALHYVAANGHLDLLNKLLALLSPQSAAAATTTTTSPPPSFSTQPPSTTTPSSQPTAAKTIPSPSSPPTTTTPSPPLPFHPILLRPNSSGNTPLHWAALNGHLGATKALVSAGADLEARNAAGRDAVFEAEGAGKEDVVSWLLEVGVERDLGREKDGEGEGDGEEEEDGEDEASLDRAALGRGKDGESEGGRVEEGLGRMGIRDGDGDGGGNGR